MRLFIGLPIEGEALHEVMEYMEEKKPAFKSGRFVKPQNLHITLEFIGESEREVELIEIIKSLSFESMELKAESAGLFKRGKIFHMALLKHARLLSLQEELKGKLINTGFSTDSQEYYPHITLVRDAVLVEETENLLKRDIRLPVSKVVLFQSRFLQSGLEYVKRFERSAQK